MAIACSGVSALNGESLNRSLFSISGMSAVKSPAARSCSKISSERLPVSVALVVVGVDDALVAVHDREWPSPAKQPNEMGLEVEAHRLVEGLVDDDAGGAQLRLRFGVEVLADPRRLR